MQSDDVFPQLQGVGWDIGTTPIWATQVQSSLALREVRISYASAPVYEIDLTYEFLNAGSQRGDPVRTDLDVLTDFFYSRRGRGQSFLFRHWYDNALLYERLGVGDGSTTSWAIGRWRNGGWEPIQWVDTTAPISVGRLMWGLPSAPMWSTDSALMWSPDTLPAYTVAGGRVTFASPPAAGVEIRMSCHFFYRARFDADEMKMKNFLRGYWRPGNALQLRATLGDKL